jgi:hypothetical protein
MQTTKNLIHYNRPSCRHLNPGPTENEVGVLTTRPRRSVYILCMADLREV